jgi:cell division protein FtsZ
VAAAEMAISSPLLEASIDGAHGVLLSIQGGSDLGLFEINEAAQLVANSAAPDANIIFGAVIDDALGDEVRVTVIAAGFDEARLVRPRPGRAGGAAGLPSTAPPEYSAPAIPAPVHSPAEPVPGSSASGGWRSGSFPDQAAAEAPAEAPSSWASPGPAMTGPPATEAAAGSDEAGGYGAAGESAEDSHPDAVPAPRPADPPSPAEVPPAVRAEPAAAARTFDTASTRRRSVVFEEDDDLDVPDFLK